MDIRPLYQVIENTSSDDPLSECDLVHWFTNCMKDTKGGNTAIETAAWVFMTADSVARGGVIGHGIGGKVSQLKWQDLLKASRWSKR